MRFFLLAWSLIVFPKYSWCFFEHPAPSFTSVLLESDAVVFVYLDSVSDYEVSKGASEQNYIKSFFVSSFGNKTENFKKIQIDISDINLKAGVNILFVKEASEGFSPIVLRRDAVVVDRNVYLVFSKNNIDSQNDELVVTEDDKRIYGLIREFITLYPSVSIESFNKFGGIRSEIINKSNSVLIDGERIRLFEF